MPFGAALPGSSSPRQAPLAVPSPRLFLPVGRRHADKRLRMNLSLPWQAEPSLLRRPRFQSFPATTLVSRPPLRSERRAQAPEVRRPQPTQQSSARSRWTLPEPEELRKIASAWPRRDRPLAARTAEPPAAVRRKRTLEASQPPQRPSGPSRLPVSLVACYFVPRAACRSPMRQPRPARLVPLQARMELLWRFHRGRPLAV